MDLKKIDTLVTEVSFRTEKGIALVGKLLLLYWAEFILRRVS